MRKHSGLEVLLSSSVGPNIASDSERVSWFNPATKKNNNMFELVNDSQLANKPMTYRQDLADATELNRL
jgi:hypothetical protein